MFKIFRLQQLRKVYVITAVQLTSTWYQNPAILQTTSITAAEGNYSDSQSKIYSTLSFSLFCENFKETREYEGKGANDEGDP